MEANRRHSRLFAFCLVALCAALIGSGAAAQSQAGTGTIVGTVYDSSGAVVPGAKVSAQGKATGFTREVASNDAGQYRIILLPPGTYVVTVVQSGFKTNKTEVQVTVGSTVTIDVKLAVGAATETIEVTASVVVETTSSISDALINQRSIAALPINGRRFHDFVTLTPTVQIEPSRNGISFAGQRGINANVTVDGSDYNEPFFGGIRGGERSNNAFSIPQESIQEFQVVAYGYSAEFGRSTGGVLNAVTKSGSNDWHGSAFWYGRFSDLATKDAFNRSVLDNQHQFGGAIAGPIVKDRTFFFFSVEDQQVSNPREVFFSNLTTAGLRTTANAEAFDFYRGLEGPFTQTNDAITFLGKVDQQFTANHRASIRYHYSKNEAANAVATGEQISPQTTSALSNNGTEGDRTHTVSGQWTGVFYSNLVNEFRGQWSREDRPRTANSAQSGVSNTIGNYGTRSFLPTTLNDYRLQLSNNLNWTTGRHSIKIGGDYNHLFVDQFFKFNQFGIFTISGSGISTILDIMALDPATATDRRFDTTAVTYRVNVGNGSLVASMDELSMFVHDTWRIHPRFTLNLGLRWEGYFNPSPDNSNAALTTLVQTSAFPLGSLDPTVLPDNLDQFMPRLGFAWDPKGDQKTVIRANGGIYYARTPMLLMAAPLNNFRTPAGDLSAQLPLSLPTGFVCTPLYVGDNCNTVYSQMRRAGIDLNTLSLANLPTLTQTDIQNIATALGLVFDPNRGLAPITWSANYEAPRAWQWSAGIDHELARGWSVGAEYVYINTVHLQRNRDYNLPTPSVCPDVNSSATVVTQDFQLRPIFHLLSGATAGCPSGTGFASNPALTRPVTSLGSVQARESNSRAFYRAVTMKSVYRRSKWQLQTYYTLAKNLSDDDNERDSGGQSAVNSFNLRDEYSYSNLDTRHLFLVNGLYEMPWGFTVSSLGRFRSGRPLDARAGFDVNEDTINNDRPFIAPGVPMPRNAFRDRPVYNFDMRLTKAFKFGERYRAEVTADFFNVFNFDNVVYGTGVSRTYGIGISQLTGAAPTVDSRFQQLYNPANCSPTLSTGAVNTSFNQSCYNTVNTPGAPFQMQIGVRFQF
jgi:hypothetical protein